MPCTSQPRNSVSDSLSRELNMYARAATAAGVGVVAITLPANAKIVYTPAHQRITTGAEVFLDLNHDGIRDFRFLNYTSATGAVLLVYAATSAVPRIYQVNGIVGAVSAASALRGGRRIGPGKHFIDSGIMGGFANRRGYFGQWADSGKSTDHHYLGLQFVINNQIHYGWARLNVRVYSNPKPTVFAVITGYAYETIPGKTIITGATKGPDGAEPTASLNTPTPGPVTLAALALGSPGLSIWRREEAVVGA